MTQSERQKLRNIRRFDQLVAYLHDELDWPIGAESFEDLTFSYTADELGIDPKAAAKIDEIKRMRPLTVNQPWGIFFVKFEPKRLPVVALRRVLSRVVLKKRASANKAEHPAWQMGDILFVSNYGEGDQRQISFAHFSEPEEKGKLPTLKVLGWDNLDTHLHLDHVADQLAANLAWPENEDDSDAWRARWRAAFTLRHREVITTSKVLSERLAELARTIHDRIQTALAIETVTGPLTKLMKSFQTALVHDLDETGFADMYAQTITYGLLSARIADPKRKTVDDFAAHMRTNPFLKELMEAFLQVGGQHGLPGGTEIDFDEVGVSEVNELLDEANMEAVVRDFGDRNPQEDPVIHFYEHFLSHYDRGEKKLRGVFYTPRPVVSYIVRSVDELLRAEFDLEDGLADTTTWGEMAKRHPGLKIPDGTSDDQAFVQILDPATGTGTFLVEVIDLIHKTLVAKWKTQGQGEKKIQEHWNQYVPEHLLARLHGYELLMAPYAIAHLKIGLKLYETGYRFEGDERARVYLTNALEPPSDRQRALEILPALAHEARAVNMVKRRQRFTVVLGNPPYSKSSQNQGPWIEELMEKYKRTVRAAETQIQALSDDYSKFIRFAHFTLEQSHLGILSFITNNGYLDGPLFRDMRGSLLRFFQGVRVLNLHGDSRKKVTPPDGQANENVFDIQQGVAISTLWKTRPSYSGCNVGHADLWGSRLERYGHLLGSSSASDPHSVLVPEPPFFLFIPVVRDLKEEFQAGWHLYDIFGTGNRRRDKHNSYGAGFVTQQDKFAVGFGEKDIAKNVSEFLAPGSRDEVLWERFRFCTTNQWDFKRAKKELQGLDIESLTRRCLYRPFDFRYTVMDRNICTITRKRITSQFEVPNIALLTTRRVTRLPYNNVFVTNHYPEYKVASHDRNTIVFPLWIRTGTDTATPDLLADRRPNLNPEFIVAIMARLGLTANLREHLTGDVGPEKILNFLYAVLHSPEYRNRYADFLKIDFARIPLPGNLGIFGDLARLGGELIALHLMESPKLAHLITTYSGPKNPEVGRVGWSDVTVWLDAAKANAREGNRAIKPGTIGFEGVPEEVWDFHIGGYQVCHKWLKDRKGRTLSDKDIAHYQKIVVALNETIRIMAKIDDVIEEHGAWRDAFVTDQSESLEGELKRAAERRSEYELESDTD